MKKYPNSRMGWHKWYADLYNKTGRKSAEHLAMWFLLLHKAFGERSTSTKETP
mgnify:FL=1